MEFPANVSNYCRVRPEIIIQVTPIQCDIFIVGGNIVVLS